MTEYPISANVQFLMALKHVIKEKYYKKEGRLAEKAGISGGFLSMVLSGKKKASLENQEKLAGACGYSYINFLALGRKLHMGDKENKISSPKKDFDLHGGWKPRLVGEDCGYAGKVLEILKSKTIYSTALKANIDAFYHSLMVEQKQKNLEEEIESLRREITEIKHKKNENQ